jgi:flagellar biosynthesis/type III secretory pathway protein FliH
MKSYGRRPTTPQGKKLSVEHLKLQIKIDKQKAKDHAELAKKGIDTGYNQAHSKAHKKDVKNRQKYMKKVLKLRVKAAK